MRLTSQEVAAWQQGTRRQLVAWEFTAIRDMSSAYLASYREGEAPECPPPYGEPAQEFDRDVVGNKVKGAFAALARGKSEPNNRTADD